MECSQNKHGSERSACLHCFIGQKRDRETGEPSTSLQGRGSTEQANRLSGTGQGCVERHKDRRVPSVARSVGEGKGEGEVGLRVSMSVSVSQCQRFRQSACLHDCICACLHVCLTCEWLRVSSASVSVRVLLQCVCASEGQSVKTRGRSSGVSTDHKALFQDAEWQGMSPAGLRTSDFTGQQLCKRASTRSTVQLSCTPSAQ